LSEASVFASSPEDGVGVTGTGAACEELHAPNSVISSSWIVLLQSFFMREPRLSSMESIPMVTEMFLPDTPLKYGLFAPAMTHWGVAKSVGKNLLSHREHGAH